MIPACKQASILLPLVAVHALAQPPGDPGLAVSGYAGIASGLVYRGVDLSDEALVPHLDVALEQASGFYLHGWLTRVSLPLPDYYDNTERLWQAVMGAGYGWRPSQDWTLSIAHTWYRFDDEAGGRSPDYREWSVSVDYNAFVVFDLAHSEKIWGLDTEQSMLSVSGRWPFSRRVLGAATLGRIEQDGYYQSDYTFARLNLGLLVQDWSLQLQYHDTFDIAGDYLAGRTGRKWVAQVNWHW